MLDVTQAPESKPKRDELELLHLVWEHPTKVVGGLGVAGAFLCKALAGNDGVGVEVMSPSSCMNDEVANVNSYHLNIDTENAEKLQAGVESQLDLVGIDGAVADYTKEVYAALLAKGGASRCSLVHAHDWMTAAAGVCVQRALGVPLILHVHSTQVDREGAHAQGAVYQHEKWAMEQADLIIAVSDYTKGVIIKYYGISADKVRVVWNASISFDEAELENLPLMPLSIKGVVEKKSLVMFAGRLVGQKYPEAAVEIMAGALRKVDSARGVIAGGGDRLQAIRELVKFKGMGERIEVLGSVPQRNMGTIYEAASVLILPSMSEPFGLVALEAARAGVAVMVSDRCGVSELLKSAKVTELYEFDKWVDDLVALLEDKELREAQVARQLVEVESYDWSDAGDAVLEIVNELLNS
ncbi:MAG: glycosyltransferase family 4 protein [Akkermansiaceae bacterium]